MKPDEVIIGVEVRGIAQAYRLAAFESTVGRLVNDLVGGVPVSVAYCDVSRCFGFPAIHRYKPLDLTVAGLLVDEMVVGCDGKMYFRESGKQVDHGNDRPRFRSRSSLQPSRRGRNGRPSVRYDRLYRPAMMLPLPVVNRRLALPLESGRQSPASPGCGENAGKRRQESDTGPASDDLGGPRAGGQQCGNQLEQDRREQCTEDAHLQRRW